MAEIYHPIFTKFAEDDFIEILDYYVDRNPEYIPKLVQKFESGIDELIKFPQRGRIIPELEKKSITDYRELIEGNYRIIYFIKEKDVLILSIIDSRRNFEDIIITKLMRMKH